MLRWFGWTLTSKSFRESVLPFRPDRIQLSSPWVYKLCKGWGMSVLFSLWPEPWLVCLTKWSGFLNFSGYVNKNPDYMRENQVACGRGCWYPHQSLTAQLNSPEAAADTHQGGLSFPSQVLVSLLFCPRGLFQQSGSQPPVGIRIPRKAVETLLGSTLRYSDLLGLRCDLRICTSNKFLLLLVVWEPLFQWRASAAQRNNLRVWESKYLLGALKHWGTG